MGYAKHVGRVGALAVALGVGAAVGAVPGLAWATPDADSSSESAESPQKPPSDSSGEAENAAAPGSPSSEPSIPSGSIGPNTGTDIVSVVPQPDPSSQTAVAVGAEASPPVTVSATGGANTTVAGGDIEGAPSAGTASPTIAPDAKPARKNGGSHKSATKPTQPDRPVTSTAGTASAAEEPSQLTVKNETPTTATVSEPLAPQVIIGSAPPAADTLAVSAAPPESDAPTAPTTSVATTLLAAVGLSPMGTDTPSTPSAPSPAAVVVLAWQRRQVRGELAAESSTANLQTTNTTLVEPQLAASPLVAGAPKPPKPPKPGTGPNQPPITVYNPGDNTVVNGQVIGHLHAEDPNNDPLTYRASGLNPGATFQVTTVDGQFVYTPSPQAQPGTIDDFTVTVSDIGDAGFRLRGKPAANHTTTVQLNLTVPSTNRAPVATADPTVGSPDSDGVIIGRLNVVDPDGDNLTYEVTDEPTYGSVTVDPTTGIYTYTPTAEAREQAARSEVVETDTFRVSVTDRLHTPVNVTVPNVLVAELPANSVIGTVPVGDGPRAIAISPDGQHAYVANTDADSVTVLNTATDEVITTINGVGDRPVALAVNSDGTILYVANAGDSTVVAIDTATRTIGAPIQLHGEPTGIAISPDDQTVFTANANKTVTIIDTATGTTTLQTVDPAGIDVSADGRFLYLANPDQGALTIIDREGSGDPVNVPVGTSPFDVAVSPFGDRVYVTLTDEDRVAIVDRTDANSVAYVNVGDQPQGIDIAPDGRVYVANFGADTVAVIDPDTAQVIFVDVGDGPADVQISPDGTEASITNSLEDTITVLLLTGNNPPIINPTIGDPDPDTGVVVGALGATDRDGDVLTYSVSVQAANGVAVIHPATGAFTYTPTDAARHAAAASPQTDTFNLKVDDGHGQSVTRIVTVEIEPQNDVPVVARDVDPAVDGVVVVTVNATDPDGDTLTYAFTQPTRGTVMLSDTNVFTYTPTAAARHDAATTRGIDTDTFTVTITDGHGGQITEFINVDIAPAGVLSETVLTGNNGSAVYTADGSVAVVTTSVGSDTKVSVIDTATNTQIGQTVTVTGNRNDLRLTADGSRAVLSTSSNNGSPTTNVVVINTATGEQVGITTTLAAAPLAGSYTSEPGAIRLSENGTRAAVTTNGFLAIIDTDTGNRIGDTITITGSAIDPARLSDDGSRATLTTVSGFNPSSSTYTVDVLVYDTADATQIGNTISIASDFPGTLPQFSDDGTRAMITAATYDRAADTSSTQVKVIDVVSGTQIGSTLPLSGGLPAGYSHISADGDRGTVTTYLFDRSTGTFTHRVVVIDTDNVSQIGTTTVVSGNGQSVLPQFSADGARAIIAPVTTEAGVSTTRIAVIDTTTGTQLGSTVEKPGFLNSVQFNNNGTLAYVTTTAFESGHPVTRVIVVDTTTGATNVLTYDLNPNENLRLVFGPDDTRSLSLTGVSDAAGPSTHVRIVDPVTGVQIGSAVTDVPGAVRDVRYADDGTRAIVTTQSSSGSPSATVYTSHIAIVDTVTGNQIGDTITVTGQIAPNGIQLADDGTRAVYTTYSSAPDGATSRVTTVSITSGVQLGDTITVAGNPAGQAHFSADAVHVTAAVSDEAPSGNTQVMLIEVPFENNGQTSLPGMPSTSGVMISPDGTRAVQVTLDSLASDPTPYVAVIDTGTGQQVGDTVALPAAQSVGVPVYNADGSRVAVVTSRFDGASGTTLSSVSIIDTASGEQVGSTVTVAGESFHGVQFSPDGGKALLQTVISDNQAGTLAAHVTVVDADTGALIGTTPGVTGTSVDTVKFSPDGSRAYQTATLIGPNNVLETRIVVVDTATGAQVGDPLLFAGAAAGGLQLFADGSRALQTIDTRAGATPTRIYTIDMASATVIGDPIELAGSPAGIPDGNAVLNEDGTHAVQLVLEGTTTRVVVVDTATGTVVGSDATISGQPFRSARFSDDGSRVVIATRTTSGGGPGGPSSTTTRVAVVDVATGDQVGITYEVAAGLRRDVEFSPDGTRLVLVTQSSSGPANAVVTVLNAETGLVVGAAIPLGGAESGMTFSDDGSRVFFTTATGATTTVTAVNLDDGSSASTSLVPGVPVGALAIASDGKTAFQTVIVEYEGTPATRLAIVDISGAPTLIGVIAIDGSQQSFSDARSAVDGARVVVTTASGNTTTVTVIDTAPFLVDPETSV